MTEPTKPTITHNNNSTVTIEGEIPEADFSKHRSAAIKALGAEVSVDGFRKGHVPEDVLIKHIGEHTLLREMAERALAKHYGDLIVEHNIDAIGRPEVTITKLAFGNPLGFKITTAVVPKFTLPNYKMLATDAVKKKATEELIVTDEEVETFIKNLLTDRMKAMQSDGSEQPTIPELTDEIAKSFGDFKDAADMRGKIKEGMLLDKKRVQREERRMAIIDMLLKETKLVIPEVLIDVELNKIMAQFTHDLTRMNIDPKGYFKRIGKDEMAIRNEFRADAEKRAKIQLILNEIAIAEKLLPTKEEVEKEVDHVLTHHSPNKDGKVSPAERESATIYVTTILTNEKVLAFLEQQE